MLLDAPLYIYRTLLCSGDTCFGQHFSQIDRIWIRDSNRFEPRFSDRYTFWSGVKIKISVTAGQ